MKFIPNYFVIAMIVVTYIYYLRVSFIVHMIIIDILAFALTLYFNFLFIELRWLWNHCFIFIGENLHFFSSSSFFNSAYAFLLHIFFQARQIFRWSFLSHTARSSRAFQIYIQFGNYVRSGRNQITKWTSSLVN